MLEFTTMCFNQSFVFANEGTIQDKLKTDILTKVGDRVTS